MKSATVNNSNLQPERPHVEPILHATVNVATGQRIEELAMGRYLLLWLLGIPLPILFLIWMFGGLN
jgi:hypothetical protein